MTPIRVGVIGAGLIGTRRAKVAASSDGSVVQVIADVDLPRAQAVASELHCEASRDWHAVVRRPDLDLIVVAVPTDLLTPISLEAVANGKHVLLEKPMGRDPSEVRQVIDRAAEKGVTVKAGFTLRHHGHIKKAKEAVAEGALGRLLWARCVYGHGGRLGYEQDWRCQPDRVAGGELLDQGIHVLDLFQWFFGGFEQGFAYTTTSFWNVHPLEDNAFGVLKTSANQVASFHVSWTSWKNHFSFEVFGELGYIKAVGLGGGYGPEQLIIGSRAPHFGVPTERLLEFHDPQQAWTDEWREMVMAIQERREPVSSLREGWEALALVWDLYRSARSGQPVAITRSAKAPSAGLRAHGSAGGAKG